MLQPPDEFESRRNETARQREPPGRKNLKSDGLTLRNFRERLLEVRDDVGLILDADGEPHDVRACARRDPLFVGQLPMRRGCG